MPIYEYRCSQCERVQEAIQKFSDAPLTVCECGGALEKLMSRTTFALKGAGWYTTDYKRAPAANQPAEKAPAPASTPEKTPSKSTPASNQ